MNHEIEEQLTDCKEYEKYAEIAKNTMTQLLNAKIKIRLHKCNKDNVFHLW